MKQRYSIVSAGNEQELEQRVNERLQLGMKLQGGMIYSPPLIVRNSIERTERFYQAMFQEY